MPDRPSPPRPDQPPRRRMPPFRPRFTISIFYLVAFFFLFAFLQALPGLLEVLDSMPPGPEQERVAAEVTRRDSRPWLALMLSLVTTGLGSWLKVLPGMRID